MKLFSSFISHVDEFNENVSVGTSNYPFELTVAALGGFAIAGTLFCPVPLVSLVCAILAFLVTMMLVVIGRNHNGLLDWHDQNAGAISDRHGNIIIDEKTIIEGSLVVGALKSET